MTTKTCSFENVIFEIIYSLENSDYFIKSAELKRIERKKSIETAGAAPPRSLVEHQFLA